MIGNEQEARAFVTGLPEADPVAIERLERLIALLAEENLRQNLVSAASLDSVWQRHIADSAQLLNHVPRETWVTNATAEAGPVWLDLGTGAGFPGLAAACLLPATAVVMIESRARRVEWLIRATEVLDLPFARVIGQRLELVPDFPAAVISARAFAPLEKLLRISARFSTRSTQWLLPKGRSARQELQELRGWNHLFHVEQSLTDADAGIIVGKLTGAVAKKGRQS